MSVKEGDGLKNINQKSGRGEAVDVGLSELQQLVKKHDTVASGRHVKLLMLARK